MELLEGVSLHHFLPHPHTLGIEYSMYDICHALLYVEDMTIAVNEYLQKKGKVRCSESQEYHRLGR